MSSDDFLSRWSRRKHAAKRGEPLAPAAVPDGVPIPAQALGTTAPGEPAQPPEPLPPVASLTPESDFTPFMRDEVDPGLRQQALRTLFRDPRFNVMDGLDVYIDDFSKPDPIPPEWLGMLNQMARLGDYRPPEPVPDPDEATAEESGEAEKATDEQQVGASAQDDPAGTAKIGSPPPKLQES